MKIPSSLSFNFLSLLGVFVLLCSSQMNAQVEPDNKNAVYGTAGSVWLSSQISLAYERSLIANKNLKTSGKVMLGNYLYNHGDYSAGARRYENYLGLGVVQQIYFIELNAGVALASFTQAPGIEPDDLIDPTQVKLAPVLNGGIGIRYEKNGFLIRGGLNNLELLYLGLGVSF